MRIESVVQGFSILNASMIVNQISGIGPNFINFLSARVSLSYGVFSSNSVIGGAFVQGDINSALTLAYCLFSRNTLKGTSASLVTNGDLKLY